MNSRPWQQSKRIPKHVALACVHRSKTDAQLGAPLRIGENCSFYAFRANNYKLHFFETLR